jgi:hypothetical protein
MTGTNSLQMNYGKPVLQAVSFVGLLITLAELSCYVTFFLHISNHNNNVAARVIKPSVLCYRNRTNAVTMNGQIASWIVKTWYIVLVGIIGSYFNLEIVREIAAVFKFAGFALIPYVQIITSEPIQMFLRSNY